MEVKISDFGMSDERKQLTEDKMDKVPVKWLSPETMQQKVYNNKTDVWSCKLTFFTINRLFFSWRYGLRNLLGRR
jgi:serine/threonine protein kinase